MERFSGNVDGTGGLGTLTDSAWMMSFVVARQPHFPNQPEDVKIFWGYGLPSDRKGNFVPRTMAECTGKEMLPVYDSIHRPEYLIQAARALAS
jgi:oleate hydratase